MATETKTAKKDRQRWREEAATMSNVSLAIWMFICIIPMLIVMMAETGVIFDEELQKRRSANRERHP